MQNTAQQAEFFDKTANPEEIAKFSRIADEWWDPEGKFKPLHRINPLRLRYIRDQICAHMGRSTEGRTPLEGVRIIDIGCGGGLLDEPLTRLGASVTGVDASEKNIAVASLHAEQSGLSIDYRNTSAESLVTAGEQFDVVLNMEVVEHVADLDAFMDATCALVKPGGMMVLSTINRTLKSYALAIIGAEYVLRWLPRGTHDWKKFPKPSEIHSHFRRNQLDVSHMTGMNMHPLTLEWSLSERDADVNYLLVAKKAE